MLFTYIIAMLIILGLLAGWIGVQHWYRSFSAKHPEFGPVPEENTSCGMFCFCKNRMNCPNQKLKSKQKDGVETPPSFKQ